VRRDLTQFSGINSSETTHHRPPKSGVVSTPDVQRYSPSDSGDGETLGSELDAIDNADVGNPSTGRGPAYFDDILFLSGPYVRTLLENALGYAVPEFVGPIDRYTLTPWAEPSQGWRWPLINSLTTSRPQSGQREIRTRGEFPQGQIPRHSP
jgi:hypothetical protein